MLSLKTGVKTLDNQQMLELETLIDESYTLCNRLKQMMLYYHSAKNANYERVQATYVKSMDRYNRRWKHYAYQIRTTQNFTGKPPRGILDM